MMKKEIEATPVCVYRNPEHEATTEAELKTAQKALQTVLDVWNSLKLVPCTDIYGLIMNPQKIYGDSVNKLAEPPVQAGRFQVSKSAYIQTLDIPLPEELYRAAKSARQQPFCAGNPELWNVSGDQVVLNYLEAEYLIDSQSIYLSDPAKIEKVENMIKLCEYMNKVNSDLSGELLPPTPYVNQFCQGKFLLTQKSYPGPYEMSVDPAFLRYLIQ
jgi:hypothetical protein